MTEFEKLVEKYGMFDQEEVSEDEAAINPNWKWPDKTEEE